jgi:hypothetical protein
MTKFRTTYRSRVIVHGGLKEATVSIGHGVAHVAFQPALTFIQGMMFAGFEGKAEIHIERVRVSRVGGLEYVTPHTVHVATVKNDNVEIGKPMTPAEVTK